MANKFLLALEILSKPQQEQTNTTTQQSPIEEIKQLKELLDIGAITEDEFNQKKKELLNL